jgi:hypothetical protein
VERRVVRVEEDDLEPDLAMRLAADLLVEELAVGVRRTGESSSEVLVVLLTEW